MFQLFQLYLLIILIYVLMYTYNKYPRCHNSDALHEMTPMLASQWLTQKPYRNCFLFQKEHSWPYDFCWEVNIVGQTNCVHIIHPRSIIFGTHNLTKPIINNIKKFFD